MVNQANSLLTTKNAAGGPLGSPNSCVSPANRIEPRQETGGALLCSHVAGRRAHCHPALHRRPAFLPIRREGARPARSWRRVSVWNFPALYRPVQVDQRDLVIALSGSRRAWVRDPTGQSVTLADGKLCQGAAVLVPDFSAVKETGRFIPRGLPTGYRKQYAAKNSRSFFGLSPACFGAVAFFSLDSFQTASI